jgi:hypothetical protein
MYTVVQPPDRRISPQFLCAPLSQPLGKPLALETIDLPSVTTVLSLLEFLINCTRQGVAFDVWFLTLTSALCVLGQ